jgi:pimeloyl-ACP methyl ester carboxylesterase
MGEHGKYINTPQTAADMNSILDAVGQEDMAYWGFSYGSLLGQTYATLFPERSKRVIIDGVMNQFDWYEKAFDGESLLDTENVLHGFFDECVKAGRSNCSLSSLASSAEELKELAISFMEDLREQPINVYINNTIYGLLNHKKLWFGGVFPALYKPQAWYTLADHLYNPLQGNATNAFMAYGRKRPWTVTGDSNQFVIHNDGIAGRKHWPQDRQPLLDKLIPFVNKSLFGEHDVMAYFTKQQWTIPRTHKYVPRRGVKTAHPLLILTTTYDPVCPLTSARSTNEAFEGSQIVEVRGYGHCSISLASLCAAEHVRAFLYEGKLPGAYTQCDIDSPYFVKPEESGEVVA